MNQLCHNICTTLHANRFKLMCNLLYNTSSVEISHTRVGTPRVFTLVLFVMKSTKPSAEFGEYIDIFGLKTPLYAYVLGEHTSMKNEL